MGENIKMFSQTGFANVMTSDNGGLSIDQISKMAVDKIVSVSENAPEPIRQQAEAFAESVRIVVQYHLELAKREERATICHKIREAGHPDLANAIRRI
jgi:hypothetical protein